MDWKDHLREFEKMRDSTRAPQYQSRSSSASPRNQHFAGGGSISEGHYAPGGEADEKCLGKKRKKSEEEKYDLSKHSVAPYLGEEFKGNHLRYISSKDDKAEETLLKEAENIAKKRFTSDKEPPKSTMVGMNKTGLDQLKKFIRNPDTQKKLQKEKEVQFDIPHTYEKPGKKPVKALAYSIDNSGTKEHKGSKGFKSFSFNSVSGLKEAPRYRSPGKTEYAIPNHFAKISPTGTSIKSKVRTFPDSD